MSKTTKIPRHIQCVYIQRKIYFSKKFYFIGHLWENFFTDFFCKILSCQTILINCLFTHMYFGKKLQVKEEKLRGGRPIALTNLIRATTDKKATAVLKKWPVLILAISKPADSLQTLSRWSIRWYAPSSLISRYSNICFEGRRRGLSKSSPY